MGYDVNMWLRDVAIEDLRRIDDNAFVWVGEYEVAWVNRKFFYLRRRGAEVGRRFWDVYPFFQSSFIEALASYHIDCDMERITAGKLHRGLFEGSQIQELITPYCKAELAALVLLVRELKYALARAGLKLTRWDGPGSAAAALLKREHVDRYRAECPAIVNHIADAAFFGGRIELVRHGHHRGTIYSYDINSAYPAAAVHLPALVDGQWIQGAEWPARLDDYALYKVRWSYTDHPFYPFPIRRPDDMVTYPQAGTGWVWAPELYAAMVCKRPDDIIDILDSWAFRPASTAKPFAFVEKLYADRQALKAVGDGAEKAIKLALNSLYGKLAQRVGERNGRSPATQQLEWAGWITSYTRALLYQTAMQCPDAIVQFSTDALYATAPLSLPVSNELGEWEAAEYQTGTFVQSGVYWVGQAPHEECFFRGFDPSSVSRGRVLRAWAAGVRILECKSMRFCGLRYSLAQDPPLRSWRQWVIGVRNLDLVNDDGDGKRLDRTSTPAALYRSLRLTVATTNYEALTQSLFDV
jgi:hypothetical protein